MEHVIIGGKNPAIGGVVVDFQVLDSQGVAVPIIENKVPIPAQDIQNAIDNENIPTGEVQFNGETISTN